MSAAMYQPIVAAAPTYAQPVNAVFETVGAPVVSTVAAPTVSANVSYSSLSAPITTMAAPTVTSVVAAPTYTTMAASTVIDNVAPTISTVVAAPVYSGSVAAPVAAPMTSTIVAVPQTALVTQAPSYVANSVLAAPQVAAPVLEPPKPLTAGIPNPDQIKAQKNAYSAALDKQLKDGIDTIQKETEIEKNMIKFNADKQIALMQMQVEEQRNEQLALLDEQATIRQCELRKAYVERKLQLDNQANGFVMDYQFKAVQTELAQKQYEFQVTYAKKEGDLEAKFAQEVAKANTGTSYTIPPQAVATPKK